MTPPRTTTSDLKEQTLDPSADAPEPTEAAKAEMDTGVTRRKRLRERTVDKAARIAGEQFDQACRIAEEMRHKRGCPEEGAIPGEADRRVEHFTAVRPRTEDEPPIPVIVVRCMECGEEEVEPDESEKR